MKQTQHRTWRHCLRHRLPLALATLGLFVGVGRSAQAQQTVIAYVVPAITAGNHDFGGVLGLDFDVSNPVRITKLGVFDDNSDGLNRPITARLWDRSTPTELVTLDFTPEDPGELVGGSRFKGLPAPLALDRGFQGTVTAEGYGAEERLRNRLADPANIVWSTNDGNGSLTFVGASRYGVTLGLFPDVVDGGPAARYAAGTFEFQTTPPLAPGKPVLTATAGDRQVMLTWAPVTAPLPATEYRVLRSADVAGPFTQIAETEETTFTDTGLVNGVPVCYVVRAVSATAQVGPDSDVKCTAPYVLDENHHIAYFTPTATGTQAFGGSLGMDFDLENPIIVKRLGVFDENSDGLKLPLTARIFNRETQEILAEVFFTPEEPGTLIAGMRFKALPSPLRLEPGFRGVIEADGYGAEERLINSGGQHQSRRLDPERRQRLRPFRGNQPLFHHAGGFPRCPRWRRAGAVCRGHPGIRVAASGTAGHTHDSGAAPGGRHRGHAELAGHHQPAPRGQVPSAAGHGR